MIKFFSGMALGAVAVTLVLLVKADADPRWVATTALVVAVIGLGFAAWERRRSSAVTVVFEPSASHTFSARREVDGRGGRRIRVALDEQTARTLRR